MGLVPDQKPELFFCFVFIAVFAVVQKLSDPVITAPLLMFDNKIPYVFGFKKKIFSGKPVPVIEAFNCRCIPALKRLTFNRSNVVDFTRFFSKIKKNTAPGIVFTSYFYNI